MKKVFSFSVLIVLIMMTFEGYASDKTKAKTHLFILSGQSNMRGMNPAPFIALVEKEYGAEKVIIAKNAKNGAGIDNWVKQGGRRPNRFYANFINIIKQKKANRKVDTVTLCWMQGETDAGKGMVGSYESKFNKLITLLKKDLGIDKINFVIGRICDWKLKGHGDLSKNIQKMRELQVKIADKVDNAAWVDCDDLNNKTNKKGQKYDDLHYTSEGYKKLAERFAEKSIALINAN